MISLTIYVPVPGSEASRYIHPRSGIVGSPHGCDDLESTVVYFQDVIPNSNVQTWEDCVFHAAGRAVTKYPTVAMAAVPNEELIEVGTFRCEDNWRNPVYEITKSEAWQIWTEEENE